MTGRRFVVRRSGVHGRGLFANAPIAAGEQILRYGGEVITWDEANRRYAEADPELGHTFYFDLEDGTVIDGGSGGNSARYINHGCEPNCEAELAGHSVVVHALTDLAVGDELLIDYQLSVDDPQDPEVRAAYVCRCGAASCRHTMLAD